MPRRVRLIRTLASAVPFAVVILFALPLAAHAGGGCHVATSGKSVQVDLKQACFFPSVTFIQPGQSVTWTNHDGFVHAIAGTGWGHFDDLQPGQSFTYRFAERGIYAYTCFIHPGMNGAVVVGSVKGRGDVNSASEASQSVEAPSPSPAQAIHATNASSRSDQGENGWRVAAIAGFALFALTAVGSAVALSRRRSGPRA